MSLDNGTRDGRNDHLGQSCPGAGPVHTEGVMKPHKLYDLMPFRIREVLLVSSKYDAFILQEDGHLSDKVFVDAQEHSLSSAPSFTHASSGEAALTLLARRRFDLVMVVTRLPDMDIGAFAGRVKAAYPSKPIVVLTFDSTPARQVESLARDVAVDGVFQWTGDGRTLLAMVKTVEDRRNVDHDIALADIRVILVVEDSVRFRSTILTVLYPELMRQSSSLFSEGLNRLQRLMYMRMRPKVLHAQTYEEALELLHRHRENLIAVISDVGFPRAGRLDDEAGLRLIRHVRAELPDLPVLLQSAEDRFAGPARELRALFVPKQASDLLLRIRTFLRDYLGFGPFIFRMPGGAEVGRALDTHELVERVQDAPEASLTYHAQRNHFSAWLLARAEFALAARLRPLQATDFATPEDLRQSLLGTLRSLRLTLRADVVSDFSRSAFQTDSRVQRLGAGALGGKARGLAFLNTLLTGDRLAAHRPAMPVRIPQTFVLTTQAFDEFVQENRLFDAALNAEDDAEVLRRFLAADLPGWVEADLRRLLQDVRYPLAVRSSSLLEDNLLHPFAGIYATLMLPNSAPDLDTRLAQLLSAVRYVFASTFFRNARAYVASSGRRCEEEKMAVIVQQVVGQRHGTRFYPHLAGVAHSYNYYAIPPQRPGDGIVQLVLGFGHQVVSGGSFVRFCPRLPGVLPQCVSPRQMVQSSQRQFLALDLAAPFDLAEAAVGRDLRRCELSAAEADGTLRPAASVYCAQDDVITESRTARGPWVITFANVLKHGQVPLAETLVDLLAESSAGMGTDVELEFAANLGGQGRPSPGTEAEAVPTLYALQMRPIVTPDDEESLPAEPLPPGAMVCRSSRALGRTQRYGLADLVYVRPDRFDVAQTPAIAKEVGEVNARLAAEDRHFALIGPGRWGTSDPWLGVPVQWSQIAAARLIVEAASSELVVDPSQGTHFFHNLTSLGVGYFTVPPPTCREAAPEGGFVDWAGLDAQPAFTETPHLRHLRFDPPLLVSIDGRAGVGSISRPAPR
jgi:CheY-like chemotaxis protein